MRVWQAMPGMPEEMQRAVSEGRRAAKRPAIDAYTRGRTGRRAVGVDAHQQRTPGRAADVEWVTQPTTRCADRHHWHPSRVRRRVAVLGIRAAGLLKEPSHRSGEVRSSGALLGNECLPNRRSCPAVRAVDRWKLLHIQLLGDLLQRHPLPEQRVDPHPPCVVTSVAEPVREPDVVGGEGTSVRP
jgi:hypothetical protein